MRGWRGRLRRRCVVVVLLLDEGVESVSRLKLGYCFLLVVGLGLKGLKARMVGRKACRLRRKRIFARIDGCVGRCGWF